jgi:pimeloyl-ACP methyl ester carboxylesterase
MSVKNGLLVLIALLVSLTLVACGNDSSNPAPVATDYSQAAHWLSLPATVKAVDVFYLYPTAWQKVNNSDPDICDIDNPSMLKGAAAAFARQATAFETVGNIYAPYYRQYSDSSIKRLETIADIPTLDAVAAFDYYIKHFNNNRPFILVGHSQGATVLTNLLAGYMKDHPDVYSRMIAAYVIGSPVTQAYLDNNSYLKFATGPDDTGVIISYNTEAPAVNGTNPVLYGMVGLVINPLTWTTEETLIDNSYNLGSILLKPNGYVAEDANGNFELMTPSADAQIDKTKGVLICSTVDANIWSPGPSTQNPAAFPEGVFHTFDIPFYYYNLRANAQNRVNKFLSK